MHSIIETKKELLKQNTQYAETGSSARGESSPLKIQAYPPFIDIIEIEKPEDEKEGDFRFCYPEIMVNSQGRYTMYRNKRKHCPEEFIHLEAILDAYSPNTESALWDLKKHIVSPENLENTINKISQILYFHYTVIFNNGVEQRKGNKKSPNDNYREVIHYDLDESTIYFDPKKNNYIFGIKQGPLRFLQLYLLKLLLKNYPDFFRLAGQKTSTHEKLHALVQNNIISEDTAKKIESYYEFLLCIHASINQDYLYNGMKPVQYELDSEEKDHLRKIHEFCIFLYTKEFPEI